MSHTRFVSRGRRSVLRIAVLCLALTSRARAQRGQPSTPLDSLKTGARVRAISNSGRDTLEAFLRAVHPETLFVSHCRQCTTPATPIPVGPRLELQAERRRIAPYFIAQDAIVGLFAGAVAGAGVGAVVAYHDTHKPHCGDLCGLDWLIVPVIGMIGGGAGLVTGGILGATVHRESYWIEISLPITAR
jgi:hypothetical protein